MKKILMLGQIPTEMGGSYTTGVGNVILELSKELSLNYEVHIFASNYNQTYKTGVNSIHIWGIEKILLLNLFIRNIMTSPIACIRNLKLFRQMGLEPFRSLAYSLILRKLILKNKPDLIQAHGVLWLPILDRQNISIPIVETFHGIFLDDDNAIKFNLTKGFDLRKMFYESAKLVNYCTVLNDEMKFTAIKRLGIAENKIFQISNGIDVKKFYYDDKKRNRIREQYSIAKNDKVFITVASLSERKGQKKFIKFLANNHIGGFYWIIGKGSDKNEITSLIKELNLLDRIKVFDFIPNNKLFEYYSAADFYAHTSSSEGQSLAAIEAVATGLKLIVNQNITGTLGLPKIFDDQIHIQNISEGSKIELLEFEKFCMRPIDREEISKNRNQLDWSEVTKNYVQYFEKIIN